MRHWALGAAALALVAHTAAAQNLSPLVDPAELAAIQEQGDALVLDIRPATADGNDPSYAAGHIEGSVNAPYAMFRGPKDNPGQLPSDTDLTKTLQSLGVTREQPTIIVYQGANESDFGSAARVYWTLKSAGVSHLAILNGGINTWTEAGLPLDQNAVTPAPSQIEVSFSDQWLATADDIQTVLAGNAKATLIDARPENFYNGASKHAAASRPGTLPQSEFFEHSNWFGTGPAIVDADAARKLADTAGYTDDAELVSFCNTGHWAATNWFALSELAGIDNVKLYPESMVGWSNAGYEMANVPGPLRRIWLQITNVF